MERSVFSVHHLKQKENELAEEKEIYKAVYQGSGTFTITKPKRKKAKTRSSQLKNRRRGSRK
jgi:hypothetical protein